jgi:hypothetical protein
LAHFQIPLLPRYHAAVVNWLLHLRSCTTWSQTLIDTFTAIMGIDRIVAFVSPCRLLLNYLVFLLQDLIFNGIRISMQFNTGDCEGIFAIYSKSVVSILSFLLYLLQDLIFNGIRISMQFNTGDCEGIFAIYSNSVVSILSFLLYLLQDLIFNGNQIDFAHQQLFWTRRIAITSASASNLLQINERLINKMIFLSLSALSSYIEENNIGAFNTYHVKYLLHGQR